MSLRPSWSQTWFGWILAGTFGFGVPSGGAYARPAPDAISEPRRTRTPTTGVQQVEIRGSAPGTPDPSQSPWTVSGADLRDRPAQPALETASMEVPSLFVTRRSFGLFGVGPGSGGTARIRGLGGTPNSQLLVVVDGVPDRQGIFGHPLPDTYLPALVDRLNVIGGGDSVRFGSGALAGVIDIHSRFRREPGVEVHGSLGMGSFDTLQGNASVLGTFRGLQTASAVTFFDSSGHRPGAGGQLFSARTALRQRLGPWTLSFRARAARSAGADPGPLSRPTPENEFELWRAAPSLVIEWEQVPWVLRVITYGSFGWTQFAEGTDNRDQTLGIRVRVEKTWSARVASHTEIAAERVSGQLSGAQSSGASIDPFASTAASHEMILTPLPWLEWVIGVRGAFNSATDFIWAAKTGARLSLWEGATWTLRYARNYRYPTLRELFLPFPVSNPGVEPETAHSFETHLEQDWGRVSLRVGAFHTLARDLIRTFGVASSAEIVNVGSTQVSGIEGMIRWVQGPSQLQVAGAWLDVDVFTQQNPDKKVDALWQLDFDRWSAYAQFQWVGGLYANNYNLDPLPAVYRLDAGLRYRPDRTPWTFFVDAKNLLNRTRAVLIEYPQPGFHVFGGVRFDWSSR